LNSFVGIDVHKDECHATVQDKNGKIEKQGYFKNSPFRFNQFFDETDEAQVAIETGDTWQPVYDWLDERDFEVKIKTDVKDSKALADLLQANLIPEVYVPSDERKEL